MRSFHTLLLLFAVPSLFAANGPCDGLQACFTTSEVQPGVFYFENCSTFPTNAQYVWNFGDGGMATTPFADHQYAQAGIYDVCLTAWWGNCSDTTCTTVIVEGNAPCDPNFAVEMGWNDAGNGLVYFNATSNHTNTSFIWYFGDGTEGYGPTTTHTYAPGSYAVCVAGWYYNQATQDSCWTEDCTTIVVQGGDPCAGYEACFVSNALPNDLFYFDNCSTFPTNAQFFWSFGDGGMATTPQAQHQYPVSGTYEVCLTAYWGNCSDTTCTTVEVNISPCENFEVAMSWNAGLGNEVFFVATSSLPNTNFIWYYGDGTEGYGPTTTHTYPQGGSYGVCVTGWYYDQGTGDTCWTEDCTTIFVQGNDPCAGYEACFVSNALPNNLFYFDNCSTFPTNAQFFWSFGDGGMATTLYAEHQYAQAGTYEVCLTAWWGNCSDTTCTTVTVGGGTPCDPNFAVEMGWNDAGNGLVYFNATSNHANTSFIWYFGDGTEGYGPTTTHTYAPGSYNVCVSGWYYNEATEDSCWTEDCTTIFVQGNDPCAGYEACFVSNTLANNGFFGDNCSSFPANAQYFWSFGDGATSTTEHGEHHYDQPGTYEVCLTAWWGNCSDTTCTTVVIADAACDAVMANYGSIVTGNTVLFQNATTGQGTNTQWYWDFGDGSTSNVSDPTHTYGAPGGYLVCLTVVTVLDGNGGQPITCQDSYCGTVHPFGTNNCQLEAGFVANVGDVTVQFSNTTTGTGTSTTWHWDFGDGTTSNDAQPSHIFPGLGTYQVCLTAISIYELSGGGVQTCLDTVCMPVVTGVADVCDQLDADFTATANGLAVQFVSTSTGPSPQSQFYWSFGDGSTGTGPNPLHDYVEQGVYEVCLHVVSVYEVPGQGLVTCEDDQCYTVDAGFGDPCAGLVACFEALPFENGAYSFANCSQLLPINIPAYYFWDFGDGTTSDLAQPMHSFTAGNYTVCLTVTHGDCVDSTCTTVQVTQSGPCSPNFLADFSWTASGTAVILSGSATMPANGYIWHFGDGSDPGYQQVMTHLYEPPGPFEVCLTAWYWNEQAQDTCFASHCELVNPFATGVDEQLWSAMSVFPVPAHEQVTLSGLPQGTTVRLFATDGRAVRSVNSMGSTHVLDVHDLATGTYVLRLEHAQGTTHRKLVVE